MKMKEKILEVFTEKGLEGLINWITLQNEIIPFTALTLLADQEIDLIRWNTLLRIVEATQADEDIREATRYGIGKVSPNPIMLIGEVVANEYHIGNCRHKAFAGLGKNTSSYFLNQALNYTEKPFDYYITNAKKTYNEHHNKELLSREIEYLRPSKIIVLGKAAEKATDFLRFVSFEHISYDYRKNKVVRHVIPHPSYIRRFNKMTVEEYAKLLENGEANS